MFPRISVVILLAARIGCAASCEGLKKLPLEGGAITGATAAPGDGRPYCRVEVTLKPSSDSDIRMEIWLPENWNGKFEGNGNGGWTGSIAPAVLQRGVERGFATAMSDTGHEGASASFAMGHPEKLIDFGYRSTHEMTVAAKKMIRAYYGKPAERSYFTGCSAGGRQGLMEAQRFPEDYDGIVAGAPGMNWSGRAMMALWIAQAVHADEASFIPAAKFAVIHSAVLAACDAEDGVKDGVLENPTRCKFDPRVIECKNGDAADCLTHAQGEAVRKIYSPEPRNLFPGFEPGSELGWATMAGPRVFTIGLDLFRYVVFADPSYDFRRFDFKEDAARTMKASVELNALDPDLRKFAARGGKLIQYHGWSDPQITPEFSVDYFESVLKSMGADEAREFYRLYMVPGMGHCGGGEGTSTFDMLPAIEGWVEHHSAPAEIAAQRAGRDGKTDRTRPLCPFPQEAKYKGSGSTDDAANFTCAAR
jgi:feruloyl esterase